MIERIGAKVRLTVDGVSVEVEDGTTVAAAIVLARQPALVEESGAGRRDHGICGTRRSVSGEPRAALCGMGVCQECRVTIDGRAHVLACQTLCREGQVVLTCASEGIRHGGDRFDAAFATSAKGSYEQ